MSKRITEAELRELEASASARATEPETPIVSAQLLLRVVAEVRRLRAVISAVGQEIADEYGPILPGAVSWKARYLLQAEAGAIREEHEMAGDSGKARRKDSPP